MAAQVNQQDLSSPGTISTDLVKAMKAALGHLSTATATRDVAAKSLKKCIKAHRAAHKTLSGALGKAESSSLQKQDALGLMLGTAGKVFKAHKAYRAAARLHKAIGEQTQNILGSCLAKLAGGGAESASASSGVSSAPGSKREPGSQDAAYTAAIARVAEKALGRGASRADVTDALAKVAAIAVNEHEPAPAQTPGVGDRSEKRPFRKSEDNGTAGNAATADENRMLPEDWAAYRRGDPKAIKKAQAATSLKWTQVPARLKARGIGE